MGFFSDFFKVQPRKLRTDGVYIWKFSGKSPYGVPFDASVLLLFVGEEVYMEDFEELIKLSKDDLKKILTEGYYENLDYGTIKRENDQIELIFGKYFYGGQILENKLVLDYCSETYDINLREVVERKIFSNAEFNFYSI